MTTEVGKDLLDQVQQSAQHHQCVTIKLCPGMVTPPCSNALRPLPGRNLF